MAEYFYTKNLDLVEADPEISDEKKFQLRWKHSKMLETEASVKLAEVRKLNDYVQYIKNLLLSGVQ